MRILNSNNEMIKKRSLQLSYRNQRKRSFKKNEASRRCLILFLFLCDSLIASRLRGSFLC